MKPVAVVILNWNGAKLLLKYLPIVLSNTNFDLAEIVVVDNASDDESCDVLWREFHGVRVIRLDQNYGFAGGYNIAIEQIENEYIVLLNSDVAPDYGWLEPLYELMQSDEKIAACAPKIMDEKRTGYFEYAGAAGGYIDFLCYPFCRGRVLNKIEKDEGQYNDTVESLWVSGAAMMVRRNLYRTMGGLDEDFFAHMEEIDLCWRMVNNGYKILACGVASVQHYGGATLENTSPRKTYLNFRNNLTMLIKNYNSNLWAFVFAFRLILDGIAGLQFVVTGKSKFCIEIIKAHMDVWRNLKRILNKRKALNNSRLQKLPVVVKRYSVIWKFYVSRKRTFRDFERI